MNARHQRLQAQRTALRERERHPRRYVSKEDAEADCNAIAPGQTGYADARYEERITVFPE